MYTDTNKLLVVLADSSEKSNMETFVTKLRNFAKINETAIIDSSEFEKTNISDYEYILTL